GVSSASARCSSARRPLAQVGLGRGGSLTRGKVRCHVALRHATHTPIIPGAARNKGECGLGKRLGRARGAPHYLDTTEVPTATQCQSFWLIRGLAKIDGVLSDAHHSQSSRRPRIKVLV